MHFSTDYIFCTRVAAVLFLCSLLLFSTACKRAGKEAESSTGGAQPAAAGEGLIRLIVKDDTARTEWKPKHSYENRGAFVRINPRLFQRASLAEGREIVLNLFPDTRYRARVTRIEDYGEGTSGIRGIIPAEENAYFTISLDARRSRILANIRLPEPRRQFVIEYREEYRSHAVTEVDPGQMDILPGAAPAVPQDTSRNR